MKRNLIIMALIALTICAPLSYSQEMNGIPTVNDYPLADINVQYIDVQMYGSGWNFNSNAVKVSIDFGQEITKTFLKSTVLMDDDGDIIFNSPMQALNFLHENYGYTIHKVYTYSSSSTKGTSRSDEVHYILEKVK